MRGWNQFGVIETIYEDEQDFSSNSSLSLSPPFSSPLTPLHSKVTAWSLDTGRQTDVLIRVQGTCFRLHKDRMISRSSYLKRHLTGVSDFTLSPPLNITAETFAAVADFCYSRKVHITPSNVVAIRTAAELLGMTEARGQDGENLRHVTETYLRRVIGINQEYASMVLRSCLPLLPEAETTASLVSRCIEALLCANDGLYVNDACFDVVVGMHPQDFLTVADSMNRRLSNHDILYKIVDLYLKLSAQALVDCVRNPTMPLRFIMRAMLVEHLNTRQSIASAVAIAATGVHQSQSNRERTSLGDILHRDATIRQAAQMRAVMDSTNSRIQSLERELRGMKKILLEHQAQEEDEERNNNVLNSERSASFHFAPAAENENGNNIIRRGERGSVSSSGFLFDSVIAENNEIEERRSNPKMSKTLRQRLLSGLKTAFWVSN